MKRFVMMVLVLFGAVGMVFGEVVFTTATNIAADNLAFDGSNIVVRGCTLTVEGEHAFGAVSVEDAGTLEQLGTNLSLVSLSLNATSVVRVAGGATLAIAGDLSLTNASQVIVLGTNTGAQVEGAWAGRGGAISASNILIDTGCSIQADAQGYVNNAGPGGGGIKSSVGSGGGHGGRGGNSGDGATGGVSYADSLWPVELGSGGGRSGGGAGGGAIMLVVDDLLQVDGWITANGTNGASYGCGTGSGGGGAGGSIWLQAGRFGGSGSIQANGGNGGYGGCLGSGDDAGGGAGGRIAIWFGEDAGADNLAVVEARGGTGANAGQAGTVAFFVGTDTPDLVVNHRFYLNESGGETNYVFGNVTVLGAGHLNLGGGTALDVQDALVVADGGVIEAWGLNVTGQVEGAWAGMGVSIAASNALIEAGGKITADVRGYASNTGPGQGGVTNNVGSGGGHGGVGGISGNGAPGGVEYGDGLQPILPGSGGGRSGGGAGGGVIALTVQDLLHLDGVISANGTNGAGYSCGSGSCGGGAGGSVLVQTMRLSGSGRFTANGGNGGIGGCGGGGDDAGGGAGGRIAVYYAADEGFSGFAATTATGGTGANAGQNGSVAFLREVMPGDYALRVSQRFSINRDAAMTNVALREIYIDNAATLEVGGGTRLQLAGDLTLTNGASILLGGRAVTGQVAGAWQGTGVAIRAANVWMATGTVISADAAGYRPEQGPGAGTVHQSDTRDGSGGGHGGAGGNSGNNQASGGGVYGNPEAPLAPGSGGGRPVGGTGGGTLRLDVAGRLHLDGEIRANGTAGASYSCGHGAGGGGAGGALFVSAGTLSGLGIFTTRGGNGGTGGCVGTGDDGGGGAGGRVAVFYTTDDGFSGFHNSRAQGGSGGNTGQDGTVGFFRGSATSGWHLASYQRMALNDEDEEASFVFRSLLLDNAARLDLGGGTRLSISGEMTLTNSSAVVTRGRQLAEQPGGAWQGQGVAILAGSLSLATGCQITATGSGYTNRLGPGAGGVFNRVGSGAGHGGRGGQSGSGVAGGMVYGDSLVPVTPGSGGGARGAGRGGTGGGALRIDVISNFWLAGSLAANGLAGQNDSCGLGSDGGGAGGSILVNAGSLAGSGSVAANGGDGGVGGCSVTWDDAGSGAGGRVAIYWRTANELVASNLTANGGARAWPGEAGTIVNTGTPGLFWTTPDYELFQGSETVGWIGLGIHQLHTRADVRAHREGASFPILAGGTYEDSATWNTAGLPDGVYELKAVFSNTVSGAVRELSRFVTVNNAVRMHSGVISGVEVWASGTVHVVHANLTIMAGGTLVIDPGAVVKFAPGVGMAVETGGTLLAPATEQEPIYFTSIYDDTVGGDTNLDGDEAVPTPGDWAGIAERGGDVQLSAHVVQRYILLQHGGTIATDTAWAGSFTHHVTSNIVIPSGVTLTINPGAVVKFATQTMMTVQSGGKLLARGQHGRPIHLTSVRDSTVGGDTLGDGGASGPQPGDWRTIFAEGGQVELDFVRIRYAGGTPSGEYVWGAGALRTTTGAVLRAANSLINQSAFEGIHATGGGFIFLTNAVIANTERAVNADGAQVMLVNCTLHRNRVGLWPHSGTITAHNTLFSDHLETAVQGGSVTYSLAWPSNTVGSFSAGVNGNRIANPRLRDPDNNDFRLDYLSGAIDAADGRFAPLFDAAGAPRVNDPRTSTKHGVTNSAGNYPDIGAYEFVDTATSAVDLVAMDVSAPLAIEAGGTATITWSVRNLGSEPAVGARYDRVLFKPENPGAWDEEIVVAEALDSTTLGPNQAVQMQADVIVPAGSEGPRRWRVQANARATIFEGVNITNNYASSANLCALSVPILSPGEPLAGVWRASGERFAAKLLADGTNNYVVTLTREGTNGASVLYLASAGVPGAARNTSQTADWNKPDVSLGVDNTGAGWRYLAAMAQSMPAGTSNFVLNAVVVGQALDGIDIREGGDIGRITIPIRGSGFRRGMRISLVDPLEVRRHATELFFANSTLVYATFDLTAALHGSYELEVEVDGELSTLPDAFTVNRAWELPAVVRVMAPEFVRSGREFEMQVDYENPGNNDLAAPLLRLRGDRGTLLSLLPYGPFTTNTLYLHAPSPDGPAGILRPGGRGTIPFYGKAVDGDNPISVAVSYVEDATAMNWTALRESIRPDPAPDDWDDIWNAIVAEAGNTVGGYVAMLAEASTLRVLRAGARGNDVRALLAFYLGERAMNWRGDVGGTIFLDSLLNPASGVVVGAREASSSNVVGAISSADGLVRFEYLQPGTYQLSFPGYLPPETPATFTYSGSIVTGLSWLIRSGGAIAGQVTLPSGFAFAEGASVVASSGGESRAGALDANGFFAVRGLPPGMYELTYKQDGLPPATSTNLSVQNGVTLNANLICALGGGVSGRVTRVGGEPLSNVIVSVQGADYAAALTDADGRYLIEGLAPGSHTVSAMSAAYRGAPSNNVIVASGVPPTQVDFILTSGAVLTGLVVEAGSGDPIAQATIELYANGEDSPLYSATSGQSGAFRFDNMEAGTYQAVFGKYGYGVMTQAVTLALGQTSLLNAQLSVSARIFGSVTNSANGFPVPGIPVVLLALDGENQHALTDEQGAYAFGELATGHYGVVVGYGAHRQLFDISSQTDAMIFDVGAPLGSITGRTLNAAGNTPVTNVLVALRDPQTNFLFAVMSDQHGSYRFDHIAPGTYQITAGQTNRAFVTQTGVVVQAGATSAANVHAGDAVLRLRLTLPDQSPAATNGRVALGYPFSHRMPLSLEAPVQSDGSVVFSNLAQGAYEVISVDSILAMPGNQVAVTGAWNDVELPLHPGGTITGLVHSGVFPLTNIVVRAFRPADGEVVGYALSDSLGRFVLACLPTGAVRLVAHDGNRAYTNFLAQSYSAPIHVVDGSTGAVSLALNASSSLVSGSLEEPELAPPVSARLSVYDTNGLLMATAEAGLSGEFSVRGLAAGDYRIVATALGYASGETAFSLTSGQQLTNLVVTLESSGLHTPLAGMPPIPSDRRASIRRASGNETRLLPLRRANHQPAQWRLFNLFGNSSASDAFRLPTKQEIIDMLARLLGEPRRASRENLVGGCNPDREKCPEAWLWYEYARLTGKWKDFYYTQWMQDWENQLGLNAANLGLFGVNLLKLAGSLLSLAKPDISATFEQSQNMYDDVLGNLADAMRNSNDDALKAMIGKELDFIKALRDAQSVFWTRAGNVDAVSSFLTLNIDVNERFTGFPDAIDTAKKAFTAPLSFDNILDLVSTAGDFADTGMALLDLIIGNPKLGAFAQKFTVVLNAFNTLKEAYNGIKTAIQGFERLKEAEDNYNKWLDVQIEAMDNCRYWMVSCTDSNMISTNAILPDPPDITWPPGYGGRPVGGASLDPNDIIGPEGHGSQGWIRESLNLPYIIRFENMATSTNESGVIVTNWPAQEVIITNRLDAAFDLATFQLGTFGFGTNTYTIPAGLQAFSTNINREADLGFNVTLDARLDIPEGMVTWHFQSIDPITRRLISDPIAGFLPPNTNPPCGEGFVSYAIGLATNLSQGTTIEAEAGIVFDVNEPIITPRITNTLDNIAPTSTVLALPERSRKTFHVTWTGSDIGSGVAYYDIYISTNGLHFTLWQSQATNTRARYTGSLRQTNYFYAVATDYAGNREAKTPAPEAWTLVRPGALPWLLIVLER